MPSVRKDPLATGASMAPGGYQWSARSRTSASERSVSRDSVRVDIENHFFSIARCALLKRLVPFGKQVLINLNAQAGFVGNFHVAVSELQLAALDDVAIGIGPRVVSIGLVVQLWRRCT